MNVRRAVVLSLVLALSGCCSRENARNESPLGEAVPAVQRPAENPTVSRLNPISLSAVVQSVTIIDSIRFRLTVKTISTALQEGEGITSDQTIDLIPSYEKTTTGDIDLTVGRNRRLHALRHAAVGTALKGSLLLDRHQQWLLLDYE